MKDFNELINEINGTKSLTNTFANFQYRNFEVMMSQIKPLLVKYQMDLHITNDVQEMCGEVIMGSIATLTNSIGETRTTNAYVACDMQHKGLTKPQCFGVAQAYVNKQNICNLFLLSGERDADDDKVYEKTEQFTNNNTNYKPQAKENSQPETIDKGDAVVKYLKTNPTAFEYYKQKYNVTPSTPKYFKKDIKFQIYDELLIANKMDKNGNPISTTQLINDIEAYLNSPTA